MKRTNKKGFTIVELVIVIAVIAVLAAVLVPTFSNLINKANISNDTGIIKNLNTAMAIAENLDGKALTMTDALKAAADIGYNIDKLTPNTEGYHYTWNASTNRFSLLDTNFQAVAPDNTATGEDFHNNWLIAKNADDLTSYQSKGFSVYLNYEATGEITATTGIDVGANACDVKFVGANATIRMNGGNLTVDSATADVKSYGEKGEINIIKCAYESYHEFGVIKQALTITQGRVVAESGAEIEKIEIADIVNGEGQIVTAASTVTVEVSSGATVPIVESTTQATDATVSVKVEQEAEIGKVFGLGADEVEIVGATEEKKNEIVSNEDLSKYVARIGTTLYTTLAEAVSAVNAEETVVLVNDASSDVYIVNNGKSYGVVNRSIVIDLNKYTLSHDAYYSIYTENNGYFVLKNGILNIVGIKSTSAAFVPLENTTMIFEDLTVNVKSATFAMAEGNAALLAIRNCDITSLGNVSYIAGTNANTYENYGVKISIENSTIGHVEDDYISSTTVLLNVPGQLNIDNSTIVGVVHGVIVRAGSATIANSEIIATDTEPGIFAYDNFAPGYAWAPIWRSGNTMPGAVLLIGDYSSAKSYIGEARVTLENVKLVSADSTKLPTILIAAKSSEKVAILTYDDACAISEIKLYGDDWKGADATFAHEGMIIINNEEI